MAAVHHLPVMIASRRIEPREAPTQLCLHSKLRQSNSQQLWIALLLLVFFFFPLENGFGEALQ